MRSLLRNAAAYVKDAMKLTSCEPADSAANFVPDATIRFDSACNQAKNHRASGDSGLHVIRKLIGLRSKS